MKRFFLYHSVYIVIIILLHSSCNSDLKNEASGTTTIQNNKQSSTDNISCKIFTEDNHGYGFDILLNGKVYIHQPIIPCRQGLQNFATEQDAEAVAKFIVIRLRSKNFKFLLQKFEIDSLIGSGEKNINPAFLASYFNPKTDINNSTNFESSSQFIIKTIPSLTDPPIKKKWTAKENVPFGKRGGGFSFAIGKSVYIGSGENKDEIIKDFWCYNTDQETWTCLAEIPAGCYSGIAFSIFNKGYAGLGTEIGTSSGKFKKHMFRYEPETNSWKQMNEFPGTGRIDAVEFVINNKAYAGTGYDGSNTRDFYEYEPKTDNWKRIADFAGGDLHASIGIGTGKRGFTVAGARAPAAFKFVYEYIPLLNKWERMQDLPGYARNFLYGNYIDTNFIIAGCGGSYEHDTRLRDFYVYDIATNTWSSVPDYPVSGAIGNARPCGANVDGKIFMGTGYNVDYLNDWNVFEYYYTVRTDTGLYNETVCYPLTYNGKWQLYQECTKDNCYAGAEIKTNENLGNICYSSNLTNNTKVISVKQGNTNKNYLVIPRLFTMSAEKKFNHSVSLRLFFTQDEFEKLASAYTLKTGVKFTADKIKVLQYNINSFANNQTTLNNCKLIMPNLFSYGFKGQTIVAEFNVSDLQSVFCLGIQLN